MSEIRKYLVSRYPNGKMIEVDFSQLELRGLAVLSQDETMIQEFIADVDMHCRNAAEWKKCSEELITEVVRRIAKILSFRLIYGSAADSLAKEFGISYTEASEFIKTFYKRFPRTKQWQEDRIKDVNRTSIITDEIIDNQYVKQGFYVGPTGHRYVFKTGSPPDFLKKKGKTDLTFSPTQIKNYGVQGFCTGDIVPMMLLKLYRAFKKSYLSRHAVLVGTVHDSCIADSQEKYAERMALFMVKQLETAREDLLKVFNYETGLDFPVDAKLGKDLASLEKL